MKKPQSKSLAAFESGKSVATYLDRLVPLGDKPANILCRMINSTKHLPKAEGTWGSGHGERGWSPNISAA